MSIAEILAPERVQLDLPATSKKRVLESVGELIAQADAGLRGHDVSERLFARERLGSTGLGDGVALPHARVPRLTRALGAFLRLAQPIDYDAPDGVPVDLVFGLLVPEESTEEHLQILARVAEGFADGTVRERLRAAGTAEQARAVLLGAAAPR